MRCTTSPLSWAVRTMQCGGIGAMLRRCQPSHHAHTPTPVVACIVAGVPSTVVWSVQGEERNACQNISGHLVLHSSFRSGSSASLGNGGTSWGHLGESLTCQASCSKKRTCSIVKLIYISKQKEVTSTFVTRCK